MRIVIDAMGSDAHPKPDVLGAILAAQETGDTLVLVGDEAVVKQELSRHKYPKNQIEVVHAPEAIGMTDKPSLVLKAKPQSSMHVGMQLVKDGVADAFVSMGNTGAAHAIATLGPLKRIKGVKRPALSGIFPLGGHYVTFVDLGANADCKPDWLVQFAIMGEIYARRALGLEKPRIALLSNGEEEGKGNQTIRDAAAMLQNIDINFVGNVEPKDIMWGTADVVVADGFIGNIFAKTFEASGTYISNIIRDELRRNVLTMLGALLSQSAFKRVRKRVDTFEVGGAPLLGVNGVVIIGHGRSNEIAIKNAVLQARKAVQGGVIEAIREGLGELVN